MPTPPALQEIGKPKLGPYKVLILRVLAAMGISLLIAQINVDFIESYFYDLRIRTELLHSVSGNIELIYVTPKTIQLSNGYPQAKDQNHVLEVLAAAGAKTVVYDFDLLETQGTTAEKDVWENTIVSNPNVHVVGRGVPVKGEEKQLILKQPLERITLSPSPKTADLVNFAKDGVTRRMILTYQNQILLPVKLASMYNPEISAIDKIKGVFKFYDTDQAYIDFRPPRTYPATSFEDMTSGKVDLSKFKDKIVLIGTDLNLNEEEYALTPYGRTVTSMTRAELQANIIDTLIWNTGSVRFSNYLTWFIIFLASLIALTVVLKMKPAQGLMILLGTVAGFTAVSIILFWLFRWWLPMAAPLLTIFLCYYFFIPYRLIIENRRSWEYYQKNKLLSQVEELKTNFISMMSHDLKTPIARIQGMTDMILADSVTLSSPQREAVDTIRHSSDDLLKFINAILNYGKIESQGVQLNLQSRDINNLLQEVIRKHEFLAKVKRIQIVSELEPMFPVTVDADLMRQVFSNLVENAIKYSPEDTKIMVSSEEGSTKVIVQVADQGPGIPSDELQNIFTKFFRSKNAKSSPIKGSGLGLYLAKYFTELHKGQIFVESTHGNGSTFTVELPIEQGGKHA